MNILGHYRTDRATADRALRKAAEQAGEIIFPLVEAEKAHSTGGVLSVWYDETLNGVWTLGANLQIGTIGNRPNRTTFESCKLYTHHATCKNIEMINARLEGRTDDSGRVIIASSQLADETPEDPFDKRYGGGIMCCDDHVAISFSGLPWKWDEVMAAHVAYLIGPSITIKRVWEIVKVSGNEHLDTHLTQHFGF
jgi:hypothetical protein